VSNPLQNMQIEGYVLQIKKIGNSVGLILPRELLARLKLKEGDKLTSWNRQSVGSSSAPMIPLTLRLWRSRGALSENTLTPTRRWPSE
jgi:hypothetical protein